MPIGTCDHDARGEAYNEFAMELPLPDGSGYVLVDCRYTWDHVSTKASPGGCDGPVIFLWTRNTGTSPAWAMLPDKKRPPLWVKIDPQSGLNPNADPVTAKGQLTNLGLSNASDVRSVQVSFVDPTISTLTGSPALHSMRVTRDSTL